MRDNVIPLHPEGVPEDDIYASFLSFWLSERAESTSQAYLKDLSYLRNFLNLGEVVDVVRFLLTSTSLQVNRRIQAWKQNILDRSLAPNTLKRRLGTVRALLSVARSLGLTSVELSVRNVPLYRVKDAHGPTPETIAQMIQLLSEEDSPQASRNESVVRLAYEIGLRRQEICFLDVQDVDLAASRILVTGKGREQKESLALPSPTRDALARWLRYRGSWPGPLFISLSTNCREQQLSGTSIYRIIREVGKCVGSPTIVRPHGLRRAAINQAVTIASVREACRFSRHKDVRSLQEYFDHQEGAQSVISDALAAGVESANETRAPGDQGYDTE